MAKRIIPLLCISAICCSPSAPVGNPPLGARKTENTPSVGAAGTPRRDLSIGFVRDGCLFATGRGNSSEYSSSQLLDSAFQFRWQVVLGDIVLFKVPLVELSKNTKAGSQFRFATFAFPPASVRLRPRFANDCFWANAGLDPYWGIFRCELKELAVKFRPIDKEGLSGQFEPFDFRDAPVDIDKAYGWRFSTLKTVFTDFWQSEFQDDDNFRANLDRLNGDSNTMRQPMPVPPAAFMDYLPVGRDRLFLFLAWEDKIRVWEETHDPAFGSPQEWRGEPRSLAPLFSIASDWAEPFYVLGSPPDLLFVTESGRLYGWHAFGTPDQQMVTHWQSAQQIHTLIADYDTEKTWAFASPASGSLKLKSVYFALDLRRR